MPEIERIKYNSDFRKSFAFNTLRFLEWVPKTAWIKGVELKYNRYVKIVLKDSGKRLTKLA